MRPFITAALFSSLLLAASSTTATSAPNSGADPSLLRADPETSGDAGKASKPATAGQPDGKKQPLRLIVLDLKGGGLEAAQLEALSGYVTVTLSEYEPLEVLSGADVRAMVELEGEKQAMGCESDASCLAEIAGAMGARLVVFGQMAKLGTRFVLNLSLFDSEAGKAVGRSSIAGNQLDDIFEQLPAGVHKLVAPFLERQGYAVAAPSVPAVASAKPPPEPAEEERAGSPFAFLLPASALALGGGLVATGVALDLLLPSSHNKRLDEMDLLSTGAYVAAAGAGTAGVVLFFFNPLAGE